MDQWWLTVCGSIGYDRFKKKKKVYWKDMLIQLFYTLYLNYMEKKVK